MAIQSDAPAGQAHWVEAPPLAQLHERGPTAAKLGARQVALFLHEGEVLACNNRCPHEGYPLCEGALDRSGVLTCHWHNWKFDLRSGTNLYGGDALRVYPVRVEAGRVWVDVSDPPPAQRVAEVLGRLAEAMAEDDYPRVARELARLEQAGAPLDAAALQALEHSHTRLRNGMTHAYPAIDAWLRLRDQLADSDERLACVTEALAHVGFDTLREAPYPYATAHRNWQAEEFLTAVETQDEAGATERLNDALAQGIAFDTLEPVFAQAALAHYNAFGHSLIYLTHVRSLIQRLGPAAAAPLLRAWTRSLVLATREDLLPDFKAYAGALEKWPRPPDSHVSPSRPHLPSPSSTLSTSAPPAARFEALKIRETLAATLEAAAQHTPLALWHALMQAAAHHLLRFDERFAQRTDSPAGDDVNWLDFSHALTFGHAVRQTCTRWPQLWPQGLLQMALFVGRNTPYLAPGLDSAAAQAAWAVDDAEGFDTFARTRLIDHGIGLPIYPVHWLKTWLAVRDSIALGLPQPCVNALRAAVRRLLSAQFKQRHALRSARQAQRFVERE